MRIRNGFEHAPRLNNFLCLRSNLNNDNVISSLRQGLKKEMDFRVLV